MKKVIFLSIISTFPLYFVTGAMLGLLFPTAPEDRIPGLFELHLVISFFLCLAFFLYKYFSKKSHT